MASGAWFVWVKHVAGCLGRLGASKAAARLSSPKSGFRRFLHEVVDRYYLLE
jgi:hypothetical protein